MAAKDPEEAVRMVAEAINAGRIDDIDDLYEPDAVLVVEPGKTVTGIAAVHEGFAAFMALKPALNTEHNFIVSAPDLALISSKWSLSGTDPEGKPVAMNATSMDVVRRQADGSWKVAIDNPFGA